MATAENTAPAGAHSPAVPESIIRAAAEAPSPPVFLEFDELLETLLNLVSHLRCADGVLYELQVVPEPLRGAGIVLHDAVENLAGLHNRLQEWPSNADREARYAGATDAHATWSAELPGAVAQSTHPFSRTAPGSRRTCRTCLRPSNAIRPRRTTASPHSRCARRMHSIRRWIAWRDSGRLRRGRDRSGQVRRRCAEDRGARHAGRDGRARRRSARPLLVRPAARREARERQGGGAGEGAADRGGRASGAVKCRCGSTVGASAHRREVQSRVA